MWAAVLANRAGLASNPLLMLYVLLSVLLSSLLLSPRATALLAAVHLLGLLLAPAFIPGLGAFVIVNSFVFISFIALVTIVGASLRQREHVQLMVQTRALGESEQRFRLLLAASPDAVLLIDPHDPRVDWPIVDCNAAACRMNGFARAELLGASIDILNASPGTPQERADYLERLRRELALHVETFHRRKDGTLFSVEVSASLITLSGRELVLGIDRDITERKHAEEALRQSEERFQLVSYATNDTVWDWDARTNQVWWNAGVQRLFGYAAEQVGPDITWWEDHIHPDDRGPIVTSIHAVLDGAEEFWTKEYRFRRAGGAYAQVLDRGYVMRDEQGKPRRMLGAMMDITARQQEEQRMRAISDILRVLNATPEVADAFSEIASQLKLITGCERISLALGDDRQDWFTVATLDQSHAEIGGGVRFQLTAFAGEDLLAGRLHLTPDLAAETRFPIARALYEAGYRSLLTLPLRHGGVLLGMLNFSWRQPAGYSIAHFPLLSQIAEALSLATARSRAFETERRLRARAQTLQKLGSLVASSLDLSEVFNTIAQQVLELMEVPVCTLMLWEPPDDLVCKVCLGLDQDETGSMRQKVGQGLAGWIAARRQPLIVEEMLADGRTSSRELAEKAQLHAYLGVPLEAKGNLIGTLDACTREPRHFSADDAALLVALAAQASLAIENVRLFDETQRRAHEAETLRQAGAVVASTLRQEEAIERILEQLARVVPHDSASVQLLSAGPPGYLELVGGRGWPDPSAVIGLRIPVPGENPNTLVIQERKPVNLGNAPAEQAGLWEGPHSFIRSWLGVPLIVYDRVIGMLTLDSALLNVFTPSHVRLVGAFADQVAIALEHARLFTEAQRRAAELQAANQELENGIAERQRAEEAAAEERNLLRTLIDNLPDFVYVKDVAGRFMINNIAHLHALGATHQAAVLGKTDLDLFPGELGNRYLADEQPIVQSGQPLIDHEEPYRNVTGERRWLLTTKVPLRDSQGQIIGLVGMSRDVTERKQTEQALESANQQLVVRIDQLQQRTHDSSLVNEMSDLLQACLTVDEAYGVIARLGRQLFPDEAGRLYMLNASRGLVESVTAWGASLPDPALFEPNDCWGLRRGRLHLVEPETIAAGDTEGSPALVCRHVEPPWPIASVCVPLVAQGEALGMLHLRYLSPVRPPLLSEAPGPGFGEAKQQLIQAVADSLALALANLKLRATLRQQSIRDPLTGLFNRRYLDETLEREVQRAGRRQGVVGIIMLDLDKFKDFNDTFGHEAGDTALRELGTLLRAQVRGEDIACRYGGEEFTLIMPEASLVVTQQRAEQVREQVKHLSVQHRGQPLGTMTVSLGVAVYPDHGATGEVVLRAADAALYRAKREGRDRVTAAPASDRPGS